MSTSNQHTAQDLIDLSRQKWDWMSAKDTTPLASLFHSEAVFVHMGATFSRDQELEIIRSGHIHYRDIDIEDVSVRFVGDTAIVLSKLKLGAEVAGNVVTNPFTVTEVFVRLDAVWMLASMSFTRLITA